MSGGTVLLAVAALATVSLAGTLPANPKTVHGQAYKTDPEEKMSTPEMIQYWGYPVETHTVTTQDGYILTMHRIPHGKTGALPEGCAREVIFMQHGLESASSDWVINLPSESPGFHYADAGYDVWLGNFRGNTYSKGHDNLSNWREKYWEFSWDEMALYDLKSMVNYALRETGKESLIYMGHSQGTLTMFSLLSVDQEFATRIREFYALAPVGTVAHIQGAIKFAADWFLPELKLWYSIFGSGEFLPNNWVMHLLSEFVCGANWLDLICDNLMFLIAGPEQGVNFNKTRAAVYTDHTPAGTSTQNIMHWAQMVKKGTVSRYDFGSKSANKKAYGTDVPPAFDFSTVNVPMHLYWSDADWLADKTDIEGYLLPHLNPALVDSHHMKDYNHLDFVWGLNVIGDIHRGIVSDLAAKYPMCPEPPTLPPASATTGGQY